ncbi:hypothetical protein [Streptomyces sp. DI166]|uniref:hypothetical protein n=1 Tax=Streptomyces sp. DI166 TaxID=1839783 RepID=UPI001147233A|nr:hypothetical protein [Streptomyces sp. DI166]
MTTDNAGCRCRSMVGFEPCALTKPRPPSDLLFTDQYDSQAVPHVSPDRSMAILVLLTVALTLSLAAGIAAAALTRWDGTTVPAAITRGAIAFGSTLSLCIAGIALLLTART